MIIVLVTHGKHEEVDRASVRIFHDMDDAESFMKSKRTGKTKYWTDAQIIDEGREIELNQPE